MEIDTNEAPTNEALKVLEDLKQTEEWIGARLV